MSFEEKMAWVTGTAVAICWGWYATIAAMNLSSPDFIESGYIKPIVVSVVASIIIIIAGIITLVVMSPKEAGEADERDRDIERFGNYVGQFALSTAALGALALALARFDHFWIANLIYLGLVLSEVVTSIARIVAYRYSIHQW